MGCLIDGVSPVCGGLWDFSLHSWSIACVWRIVGRLIA